ncbi:MAG TPA: amino acid ABC transporter substrate-binding protein [Burkholderiales bacterium]
MKRLLTLALLASFSLSVQAATPNTLAKIKSSKTITLAYAPNAIPFSFDDDKIARPVGYSIDLCESVVAAIKKQLGLAELRIKWVAGTTPERLAMVAEGKADMECGVTTATLKRQEKVDFTGITFVQAGGILTRAATGVKSARDLGGKKIAVVAGTTTEKRLVDALGRDRIMAEVVPFKDRAEAFRALEEDKVSALAGDKIVLIGLVAKTQDINKFVLLSEDFSIEPYAFALRRGDPDFRLAVNRGLARTYASGDIVAIFDRWFSPLKPTDLLKALYLFSALEE